MITAFDASTNCTAAANCLVKLGYKAAIRYYTRGGWKGKRLSRPEAEALSGAGMSLAAVFQDAQNKPHYFSKSKGLSAGRSAYRYAEDVIGQPAGSGIYFAVDYDASSAEISNLIVPYFEGVVEAFASESGGASDFRIGAYGSGALLEALTKAGLIELAWLCMSTGYRGWKKFYDSGNWHIRQHLERKGVCGINLDPDEINPKFGDFGEFSIETTSITTSAGSDMRVIAKAGLRIRSGPGVEFGPIGSLSYQSTISVIGRSGDWALIDQNGDGGADGYCHMGFLKDV